jgi:hypothetical protein
MVIRIGSCPCRQGRKGGIVGEKRRFADHRQPPFEDGAGKDLFGISYRISLFRDVVLMVACRGQTCRCYAAGPATAPIPLPRRYGGRCGRPWSDATKRWETSLRWCCPERRLNRLLKPPPASIHQRRPLRPWERVGAPRRHWPSDFTVRWLPEMISGRACCRQSTIPGIATRRGPSPAVSSVPCMGMT